MGLTKRRIEANYRRIQGNIEAACARSRRDPDEIHLVAVTKSVEPEVIRLLWQLGLRDFGENRAQQLVGRAKTTAEYLRHRGAKEPEEQIRWHMVGHVQRNKVRSLLGPTWMVHSVDSLRLAESLSERAGEQGREVKVLLQVNCSEEQQKYGVAVGAATHLGELVAGLPHVQLAGLMTMAAHTEQEAEIRLAFGRLREIWEEMRSEKIGGEGFRHLSMGMSNDYLLAIEEGATILRIGRALFE
jgi:hypothetical protein